MKLNKKAKLNTRLFDKDVNQAPTRHGYGEGVIEAGIADANVVVICADLSESTRSKGFQEKFPSRFIEVGVAEQLLATIGSGMANYGKIPFIASYAAFSPGRNWEQIRTTIALNDVPVKICGMHAGISVGPDGATHQALEDIATMRTIPRMNVVVPADKEEARKATKASAKVDAPVYLRFGRENVPIITTKASPFRIGKAEVLCQGSDVAVVACGSLVYEALQAAKQLDGEISVAVVNSHTIKPLDKKTIISIAKVCGAVVTAEEAQVTGGLGGAVAETLASSFPVPIEFIGVQDCFGESGPPDLLMEKFNLKANDIVTAIRKVVKRK